MKLPRNTIRLRLTLLYGALFLVSGAVLLAITYIFVAHRLNNGGLFITTGKPVLGNPGLGLPGGTASLTPAQVTVVAQRQSNAALHQLVIQSGFALGIMAVASIWLGWLVAGRALRPLRTITTAAREISAGSLHRRLALAGPDDELKQLGKTFDELLARLEASFDAQRRFVANASHELRTPLTLERAQIEVALADPDSSVETLTEMAQRVLATNEQQERLIEALLTLSRSQRGLDRHERISLVAVIEEALATVDHGGLTVTSDLQPAHTTGDPRLVERLAVNLIGNAVSHNVPKGRVAVRTASSNGRALLAVENTGPLIAPEEVERLFQPFQRRERTSANGSGLGLSIVDSIAAAHDASVTAEPLAGGGLRIAVAFPSA
ncbi:MAG TPA: ATP-binding protein [Gaiellaceae bacterium]